MSTNPDPGRVPPGTDVAADHADIGEDDIARPKAQGAVPHPETGDPALAVETGGPFKKTIIVPADRFEAVQNGKVVIELDEQEAERLSGTGTSVIPPREDRRRAVLAGVAPEAQRAPAREVVRVRSLLKSPKALVRALGPGVISGAADNDPTTVGTLAVIGSQTSFGLAWLLVLVLPMMASIQAIASAVGVSSGKDLQELIRQRFGRLWTWVALVLLVGVNVFTLAADLEGGAAALGLLTHVDWRYFTLPLAALVAVALLLGSYEVVRRILIAVVLIFLLYIPAALLAHPDWGAVLRGTFVPHLSLSSDYVAGALALLGTTLTSYVYYWETIEEHEQAGSRPRALAMLDAGSGMVIATLVFWFILVTSGATLGSNHQTVPTAQDAAAALKPIAGPAAQYLFAGGLLASALLALPVIAGTTAYAVGETAGWPVGLSRQPWRSQGFYLVLLAALLLVVPLTFVGIAPMTLLFVAGIIGGVGTPVLLVLLLLLAQDPAMMRGQPIPRWLGVLGWGTAVVVTLATLAYLGSQVSQII